jgi:hypothetical protein
MGCLVQTDPLPNGVHLINPKTEKVLSEVRRASALNSVA